MKKGSLINSFKYAIQGIIVNLKTERNLIIHFITTILITMLGFILKISLYEWISCIILFGLVISLELMNTSFEKLVDLYTKEIDPRIKFIKDTAAASVFIAAIVSLIVGVIIFLPKIIKLF